MVAFANEKIASLGSYKASRKENSISGLSSGAFMTVQLHLAHSASFAGAGIIAGGPFRCAETYRRNDYMTADDVRIENSLYICMNPLIPQTAPDAKRLAQMAKDAFKDKLIDDWTNLADDRLYIFTGSADEVVYSDVVERTRQFYETLGVKSDNIRFVGDVPAGHCIVTKNPEDSALNTNQPPYINQGSLIQSHDILHYIYRDLQPAAEHSKGELIRFEQGPFVGTDTDKSSMSEFGYVYIPSNVLAGKVQEPRVHIVLHGCKQGYNYRDFVSGRADIANRPPYGNRYITTTGYNEIGESNDIIMLYPQAEGIDNDAIQNPEGCWDWWGYTDDVSQSPYYSRNAIQIRAIHAMLERLCG